MALARKMAEQVTSKFSGKFIPKYFDIGVNFSDAMFKGQYNGKPYHKSDLDKVISRARLFNVEKFLVTGSSYQESMHTMDICKNYPEKGHLYSTVGIHPCSVADEFCLKDKEGEEYHKISQEEEEKLLNNLYALAIAGSQLGVAKAFGEIGLDYDRLHYTPKELQKEYFHKQLQVALDVRLPLFLHMRAACDDFIDIIQPFIEGKAESRKGSKGVKLARGVVHSFTGTEQELERLLKLGFYIGINGCSLRTEENCNVAAKVPLDKLLIETDAPWCEIRKSHASYKFLTAYPNKFYPKISVDEVANGESTTPQNENKKQLQKGSKNQQSKQHELLPFPSLKKDHYVKKYESLTIDVKSPQQILESPVVKSRNEPVYVGFVAEIVASLKHVSPEDLISQVYKNGLDLFELEK